MKDLLDETLLRLGERTVLKVVVDTAIVTPVEASADPEPPKGHYTDRRADQIRWMKQHA